MKDEGIRGVRRGLYIARSNLKVPSLKMKLLFFFQQPLSLPYVAIKTISNVFHKLDVDIGFKCISTRITMLVEEKILFLLELVCKVPCQFCELF